ncbi:MAG: sigma-70 family RNA polymerase sigma factor [Verrucomicrobiales bacterium]|nr:sigma-70 family RNA polymerase sigma factor [Verrucomicrobiales bacterium]MCP5557519.1 sigma-70 family RNA polymerase sigma factor [Verrucomicrobiaceae bacterium]
MSTRTPTVQDATDEDLLVRAAGGDQSAFSALYDRFSPPLFALMRQMLGDETEAEDVLQEGFVYVWKHASQFDAARAKPFTWAVMIFRHKAIDRIRARGRRARMEEAAAEMPENLAAAPVSADEAADAVDRVAIVREAVRGLPGEQRRMIELSFLKGLTHHDIASTLAVPLGTVKTNIRRGLLKLRDLVKGGTQ